MKAEAKAKAKLMLKVEAMAKVLVEEMQLGMAGAVIQGGVKKAAKEAVIAERKDSGRP